MTSGGGGRSWSAFQWTVTVNTGADTSAILQRLDTFGPKTEVLVTVPKALMPSATYTFSLSVTNFFGQTSSATAIFSIDGNPNLPIISVQGSSVVTIVPNDVLTLFATTARTSCFESASTVSYSWKVLKNGVNQNIPSVSSSATKFQLSPYTLTQQTVYTVELTATATATDIYPAITTTAKVTVNVGKGKIVAVVLGGSFRGIASSSATGVLSLDASQSYDQSFARGAATTTALTYTWTCLVVSTASFGSACTNQLPSQANAAVLTISTANLVLQELYQFTVAVTADDGRTSSYAVTVQNSAGSTSTAINNVVLTKVNPSKKIVLTGLVKANSALTATWSALIDGVAQTFSASTPLTSTFSATQVSSFLSYPLSVPGNTFVAGSTVTFRLLAHFAGNASRSSSFSDVAIVMNAPPSGGSIGSDPLSGSALSTTFALTASSWSDDPTDYPLNYEFTYQKVASQNALTVQSKSTSNRVTTTLPAGLASQSYQITVKTVVYDNFLASASATTLVEVTTPASLNVATYLTEQIAAADAAGNTEAITQAISNAASTVNEVNCTLASASFCAAQNRNPCFATAQKCSACLDGYSGLSGDGNSKCRDLTVDNTVLGEDGDSCTSDDDCALANCEIATGATTGVCIVPVKECPSSTSQTCSGHGTCTAFSTNGGAYGSSCLLTDANCVSKCTCDEGYGGGSCSLSDEELASRDQTREQLCLAVITVSEGDDISFFLLDSLISALYSSYDPEEVVSSSAQAACYTALTLLSDFSAQGYLSDESTELMVSVAAKFTVNAAGSSADSRRRLVAETAHDRARTIDQSISGIVAGVMQNMANGEDPIEIVNDEMQIIFAKSLASDLTSLSPPRTQDQIDQGITALNTIELSESAIEGFQNADGYIEAAVMNWGVNPFPDSEDVQNTLMRVEVAANLSDSTRRRAQESARNGSEPGFYLTLQFNQVQDFNFTLTLDQALVIKPVNFTYPECNYFDGTNYTRCDGCWVSTYTNHNVTYGCPLEFIRDMPALRRRLQEESDSQIVNFASIIEAVEVDNIRDYVYSIGDKAVMIFMAILTLCIAVCMYAFWMVDRRDDRHRSEEAKTVTNPGFDAGIVAAGALQYDTQYDVKSDAQALDTPAAVANFLDTVMPEESRLHSSDTWLGFVGALLMKHDYTKVFFGSSQPLTRTIRFVHITLAFLLYLFFDSIFFSGAFPNSSTCERHESSNDCLSDENKVTDSLLCKWEVDSNITNGGYCVLNPPPRTFVFVITVSLAVVIVSVPVLFVYDLLLRNICAKRPSYEPTPKRTAAAIATLSDPRLVHDAYSSADYEANQMLVEAKDFLTAPHNMNTSADQARLAAIQTQMGIYPSGHLKYPMDTADELLYRTQQNRLTARVGSARTSSERIQESLRTFAHSEKLQQEQTLVRHFVLEQFSPMKRLLLSYHLPEIVPSTPESVHPVLWGFTWAFVILSIIFLLFWGFYFGARQQGDTSAAWGMVLGTALAQEFFVLQVFRVFACSFLGLRCIRPQLQFIYRALNKVAISSIQDEAPVPSLRVYQHLSGACRAAHAPIAANLQSARILRSVDDADIALCRMKSDVRMPAILNITFGPLAYMSLLSGGLGSLLMQWYFPALFDAVLILSFYIWKGARWVLFLPYGLLIVGYCWKYLVHKPARRSAIARRHSDNAATVQHWNASRRSNASAGFLSNIQTVLTNMAFYVTRPTKLFTAMVTGRYAVNDPQEERDWCAMNRPANLQAFVSAGVVSDNTDNMTESSALAARAAMSTTIPVDVVQIICAARDEVVYPWAGPATRVVSANPYVSSMLQGSLTPTAPQQSQLQHVAPTSAVVPEGEVLTRPEDAVALILRLYRDHVKANEMSLVDPDDSAELDSKAATQCDVLVEFFDLRIMLEEVLFVYQPLGMPLSPEQKDGLVVSLYAWLAQHADALLDEHYHHDTNRIAAATLARIEHSLPQASAADPTAQVTNFSVPFQQFRSWFLVHSVPV